MPRHNRRKDVTAIGAKPGDGAVALFHIESTPVRSPRRKDRSDYPEARASASERVRWAPYGGRGLCMIGLTAADRGDPNPHRAKATHSREHKGRKFLMCRPCAGGWHAADGIAEALPSPNPYHR